MMIRKEIVLKELQIFCGVNSLGMPYTRDNKNHIGFYDVVIKELIRKGYGVSGLNFSRLDNNHTWDFEDNLTKDRSIAYLKKLQIQSIDDLRNTNALFKLVVPDSFKHTINIMPSDHDISLRSLYLMAENPIFIYSAGPNDLFSYIRSGPFELIEKKVRDQLPKDIIPVLKQCIGNVKNNWELLSQLNPNVRIVALGHFYSPLYDKLQKIIYFQELLENRHTKYEDVYMKVTGLYNDMLSEASEKYDFVDYCDITFLKNYCAPMDFHPNTKGNELIGEAIFEKLERKLDKK